MVDCYIIIKWTLVAVLVLTIGAWSFGMYKTLSRINNMMAMEGGGIPIKLPKPMPEGHDEDTIKDMMASLLHLFLYRH